MARRAVWVCLGLFSRVWAGEPALTVERLFADPPLEGKLPAEPAWLPSGTRFSYLETRGTGPEAATLLMVAGAGPGEPSVAADESRFPQAEGTPPARPRLEGYQWSPEETGVLLCGDGDLFFLAVPGGQVRRLTATAALEEEPQFSPDGRFIAFVRDNDLYALEIATLKETRITTDGGPERINGKLDWVYKEELAGPRTRGFVWSPDSRSILFLSLDEKAVPRFPLTDLLPVHPVTRPQIYPKPGDPHPVPSLRRFQLVTDKPGEQITVGLSWPGSDYFLARFGWTGRGAEFWYQLLDRSQTRLQLVVDPGEGARTRVKLSETDPAWINLHDDLHFLKDGTFLWSSEKDGFRQLFLHEPGGMAVRVLTPAEWEVTGLLGVDESAGLVYFKGTGPDPKVQHLFRVMLDGSGLTQLTTEPGTHDPLLAPGCRFALDTFSTAQVPRSLWLLDGQGKRMRAVAANETPPYFDFQRAPVEAVSFPGPSGQTLYGQMILPPGLDRSRKYPAIVYTYGGPHAQIARDAWGGRYTLFHQLLASEGFVVFWMDNRGAARRGRNFERALLSRLGKAELEDQLAGVAYLKSLPFVDGSRLGIWGWSYGGYMTCYALANAPGVFRAGAAVAPVTDWRYYDSIYTERYLKLPSDNPEGYRDSSPVNQAYRLAGSLLLIHGTGDDNVHWQHTLAMVEALYQAGKPYDLQLYPNKAHGIAGQAARTHLHQRILDHFRRALLP